MKNRILVVKIHVGQHVFFRFIMINDHNFITMFSNSLEIWKFSFNTIHIPRCRRVSHEQKKNTLGQISLINWFFSFSLSLFSYVFDRPYEHLHINTDYEKYEIIYRKFNQKMFKVTKKFKLILCDLNILVHLTPKITLIHLFHWELIKSFELGIPINSLYY